MKYRSKISILNRNLAFLLKNQSSPKNDFAVTKTILAIAEEKEKIKKLSSPPKWGKKKKKKKKDYASFYNKYIKSKLWRSIRNNFLKRKGNKCTICGSKRNIHVHHMSYNNLGLELDSDLLALCNFCHEKFHKENGVSKNSVSQTMDFVLKERLLLECEELDKKKAGVYTVLRQNWSVNCLTLKKLIKPIKNYDTNN